MDTFVIAVKRQNRPNAPEDWRDKVEQLEGVEVIGSRTGRAMRVRGPEGIGKVLAEIVGEYCHIEPVILHEKVPVDSGKGDKQENYKSPEDE